MRETSNPVFRSLPKQQGGYASFGSGAAGAATAQVHQGYQPYTDQQQQRGVSRPMTIDEARRLLQRYLSHLPETWP